ncbi:MAG TPA: 2-C-methyl-D-erythritol 4-phosphate cytidylyltransferase, partial [Bacteroidales bacterium]|nr:2-C-methyl-D-erythritol 4-phosphate cytidylyltransferase [Bacteroidales bacterium]
QCFKGDLLQEAYKQPYCAEFTDDATVVEKMGIKISLINGNPENFKITTPIDILFAEALLKK